MPALIDTATEAELKQKKKRDDELWLLLLLNIDDGSPLKTWRRLVPQAFGGLITGDGFTWNSRLQQYRSNSGTTVNGRAAQRLIVNAGHAAEIEIESSLKTAIQKRDGTSITKWRADAMDELVGLYVASAAVAAGGVDNLTEGQLSIVVGKGDHGLAGVETSLTNIVDGLESGEVTEPQAIARAGMNAAASHYVFQAVRRKAHELVLDPEGKTVYTQEINVLDDLASHCSECPALSAMGWVGIGELSLPGERECGPGCRCHLSFREREPDKES